jgi:hypothetical protein
MLVFPGQKYAAGQSFGIDIPDVSHNAPGGHIVQNSAPLVFE